MRWPWRTLRWATAVIWAALTTAACDPGFSFSVENRTEIPLMIRESGAPLREIAQGEQFSWTTLTSWWTGRGSILEAYDEDGLSRFEKRIVVPKDYRGPYVIIIDQLEQHAGRQPRSFGSGSAISLVNHTATPLHSIAYDFQRLPLPEPLPPGGSITHLDSTIGLGGVEDGVPHSYYPWRRLRRIKAWDASGALVSQQALLCDAIVSAGHVVTLDGLNEATPE